MSGKQFSDLCELLKGCIRETHKLPLLIQVAIFLDWVCFSNTYRQQKETFKISHKLIKMARRNVAKAIVEVIYPEFVKQPKKIPHIRDPAKTALQGAFGCIDGCHIPIQVPNEIQSRWRNRKGWISTNGLAICNVQNMLFTYALFGAEGIAPDSGVLQFAANEIKWLFDGFLLADAGYGLSLRVLTPYRGVRYHLKEFSNSRLGSPQNAKELFNLQHSSTRLVRVINKYYFIFFIYAFLLLKYYKLLY